MFATDGYIRVFQDVRGKYKSEGDYVMTRPVRGPLNPTSTDHVTDAWDTIDWLVKNVGESDGRVGMLGASYEGFTVVMALLDPHPALKVAAPESPMVDGWMGDDWFHYRAFRQVGSTMFPNRRRKRAMASRWSETHWTIMTRSGGPARLAISQDSMGWISYPGPAANGPSRIRCILAGTGPRQAGRRTIPQRCPPCGFRASGTRKGVWSAIHSWLALKAKGQAGHNYLVMGPWRHSQMNYDAYNLGPLKWEGDTAAQFRSEVLKPFFDQYLKDGAPKPRLRRYLFTTPA